MSAIARYVAHLAEDFHVVPLYPGTNRPFKRSWQTNRPTPEAAERAWTEWPEQNVGVIPGPNYWVLDLDGPDTVAWYHATFGPQAFDTLTVRTPGRGGGLHLWWQVPTLPQGTTLRPHLPGCTTAEIKAGQGRQVAMPPSRRPEGRYEFVLTAPNQPAPTPDWLADQVLRESRPPVDHLQQTAGLGELARADGYWGRLAHAALHQGVESELAKVAQAAEGTRNSVLFRAACHLYDLGAWPQHFFYLREAALASGLNDDEIKTTISSARRRVSGE